MDIVSDVEAGCADPKLADSIGYGDDGESPVSFKRPTLPSLFDLYPKNSYYQGVQTPGQVKTGLASTLGKRPKTLQG